MAVHGLRFNSGALRYGHGTGIDITEPSHVAEHDDSVLLSGTVVTIEPAMHTEFGRFNVEEHIVVTTEGHTVLTTVQWESFQI